MNTDLFHQFIRRPIPDLGSEEVQLTLFHYPSTRLSTY